MKLRDSQYNLILDALSTASFDDAPFDAELQRAKELYPDWPADIIHQVAIMVEEAGEAMRAALNHHYHGIPLDEVRKEVIQTGAMCLRVLENLDKPVGA